MPRLGTSTIRSLIASVSLLAAVTLTMMQTAIAADVKGVRVWRAPDHTRVVLDLSSPASHELMTLKNPERIVIDIPASQFKASLASLDLSKTPIKKIRTGVRHGKDLRLVMDLSDAVKPRSFLLKKSSKASDRLVFDLYDQNSAAQKTVAKTVPKGKRDIIVAIDAGHGGEDPGALGPGKLKEKNVVMAIAKELEWRLKQMPGYQPVLIRTGDYYIGLAKRRQLAREKNADFFVSIHADAFTSPQAHGSSVYALSQRGATSATAKFLAQSENDADMIGGVSLTDKDDILAGVLFDLSMTATLDNSLSIGKHVLKQMGGVNRLHKKHVEQAAFAVLKSPDVPSILVETGFISNPREAKNLASKNYQRKMAKAISTGIDRYFREHPPEGTLLAVQARAKTKSYTIARGDTLSGIAQQFSVSVVSLRKVNNLRSNTIRVGQVLTIPAA